MSIKCGTSGGDSSMKKSSLVESKMITIIGQTRIRAYQIGPWILGIETLIAILRINHESLEYSFSKL